MIFLSERPLFSRLDRYVAVTVTAGALVGLAVIVCLSFVFEFIDKADDIGVGDYQLADAMLAVGLSMVQRGYEAFPMATLLGALVSLGALAARSELTVMRAVGLSPARIARPVALAATLLAFMAAAVGEWVAPSASRMAESVQARASDGQLGSAAGRLWARDGKWVLHVDRVLAADTLADVTAFQVDGDRLVQVVIAPGARFESNRWQLADARISRFRSEGVDVRESAEFALGGELRPDMLEVVVVDAATLSATEIREYVRYLQANNLDSARYQLAFWEKVATPLATVVMLLLTVPLVFGPQRSNSAGQRIFIGVMIGLGFFLLNRFLGNTGMIYGLPAPLSALLPTLLVGLVALVGIRRAG